ncbi:hypothetical protein GPECTOR_11g95 [Gonium pectorale]|uniref:Pheophorbide a oxygenase domain-containing protein n=1 Tax=Gonium pectorale TaxID=33097 RepID=A0A150GQA9_GONPE|nr:hypothetical protein GPECTOR_11g95 [Gonium pectorale]|eukprot:KXZ51973.1 hypothetical protein GPECTOR_11g95 [Gonium pectorale]
MESAAAAEKPLPVNAFRDLTTPGDPSNSYVQFGNWFARDLPIRYDTLLENLVDPSHVPFAHHGVMAKRSGEKGTSLALKEYGVGGFLCDASMSGRTGNVQLQAPCLVTYDFGGFPFLTVLYSVPTKPGWSRAFSVTLQKTKMEKNPFPAPLVAALKQYSSWHWLDHITRRHPILDGDTYMLHVQERLLRAQGDDWRRGYYMPAAADSSVVAMRRWLDEFGRAVPTCEPGAPLPPAMSKREVLDRYSQHTKDCSHCQKGLRQVELASLVAAAGAALAAVWLLARLVTGSPLLAPPNGMALLAAVVCAGAVAALRSLRQQFFYVDYVHAEKH